MTTKNIIQDFCDLCRKYGLPSDPGDTDQFNWTLFNTFKDKRIGLACTALENIGDPSSVGDIARLLYQVMEGGITVQGSIRPKPIPYTNKETLRLLEGSLIGLLKQRVFRYGKKLLLSLNQTAIVVSDNADGPDDGFTFDELDSIIKTVDDLNVDAKKLRGKKAKKAESYTHTKDISPLAKDVASALDEYHLNTTDKYCFVFDFLLEAGFLDYKGEEWKNAYLRSDNKSVNKEKYDFIKSFID